jgi:hypothetical protein
LDFEILTFLASPGVYALVFLSVMAFLFFILGKVHQYYFRSFSLFDREKLVFVSNIISMTSIGLAVYLFYTYYLLIFT